MSDSGWILGQHRSDASRRELAEALRRIEPSSQATIEEVPRPFFHDGRVFQRIASSTGRVPPAGALERLQLLRDGELTLAAQVLARFRGKDKREFLDQRHLSTTP